MTSEYIHTKVCRICGRELRIGDFPSAPKNKDGHRNECRQCYSDIVSRHRKGEGHQVKHHIEVHPVKTRKKPKANAKPRKQRVANGKSDRAEYTHQYYLDHKEELKAKNRTDYLRRVQVKKQALPPKPARLCDKCEKKPCIEGFETFRTLGIGNCRDYKPRATT